MHLAGGKGEKRADKPKASVWRQALPRTSLLLFFLLVTVVTVLSGLFFQAHKLRHQENTVASLQAIADLKVSQIVQWYSTYRDQGDALDCNPAVGRWLAEFLRNPGRTDRRQEILAWMASLKSLFDFEDILLISADGQSVLALNPERGGLGAFGKENLAVAVRTAKVFISDLHRASHLPDIHMDLYVPVRDEPGTASGRPQVAGVLMFRISPYRHLFPLLLSWPMVSSTSESFLVRREGDDVLFLSDLRQYPDAPLNFRRPLTTPCLPASLAVLGMEGFIQGTGHSGRPVLSVMRPIPGTPWSLVAEMDVDEAAAPVRLTGIMLLISCLSLVVVSGLAFVFVWYLKTRELARERERAGIERQTQAAREMEASEKNLRQVIDLAPHIIYARDKTGRLILVNRRFAEWVGMTREALLAGEAGGWMGGTERAEASRRDDDQVIKTGESKEISEETWANRDGALRILQTIKVPFTPAGSSERAVLCISSDITETKQLQEQLAQAQKMEGVGRLAGGIAHDFNNLLQVIIGFNDILMGRLGEDHPGLKDAMEVDRAAKRASHLTRQLLAYSRKQLLVSQVVDLNRIIEDVSFVIIQQLGGKTEFVKQLDPTLRPVNVDPEQIQQVLMNLVSNARDAMPTGGRLTVQTKPFTVSSFDVPQMAEAKVGSYACLSVSDTGTGMCQASMDHLFEPFYSSKSQNPGAGLGLAMVHGIVKQHGGWIHVYSQDGMGTTIKVFLLVADQVSESEPPIQVEVGNTSEGLCRILVVEDEDSVRQFSIRFLRDRGFEVFSAKTAGEALTLFDDMNGAFQVVFSDVVLPDINGLDLVRKLRRKQPRVRLLLTSGYMDEKSRWPEIQREGIRFIQKPYPGRELLSVLQAILKEEPGSPPTGT